MITERLLQSIFFVTFSHC